MNFRDARARQHPWSVASRSEPLDASLAEMRVRMTVILARMQLLHRRMQSGRPIDGEADIASLTDIESQVWLMEAALRRSETRFRAIVDEASDYAILTADMEGRIDGWYTGAEAVFGWTAEEAFGQSVAITFTPEDRARGEWQRELEQVRETGDAVDVRWHVHKDGTPLYINGSAYAITGPDGEFQGMLKIGQDVTAKRAADAALRASEERYRVLLENLPDYAIFMLDPNGRISQWTDGGRVVLGYAEEEVIGQHVSIFYPVEDVEARVAERELAKAAETGRAEREGWQVRRSGERFWTNEIVTAIRDETGEVQGFAKISRDLTERRRAEEALREREERYRMIVEEATDYAIFTTNVENRIETWSPGAAAVFGWTTEEALGELADMTFTPEDRAAGEPEREYASARDTGATPDVRWHQRKDGRRVFIDGTAYAIRAPDEAFRGLLKIGQDVTGRREAERALRESEARLQERVAQATAELRSLSRRLLLVQEEERRHLARELHDEIGQALTGLGFQLRPNGSANDETLAGARRTVQELTEQVRQLSMDLRPAALDTYGLLPATRWHLDRYQTRTGVRVDLRQEGLDRRFPAAVETAAFRVIQEALTNVARHAGVQSVTVQMLADDQALTLVVRDEGRGFDPASMSGIGGLGGMRERVELLGGTLTVDTAPGAGVVVTAELPLADAPSAENE